MEADGASRALEIPARTIPIPASVSAAARQQLARDPVRLPPYPALDDLAGWRAMVAAVDGQILAAMTAPAGASGDAWADTERVDVGAGVFVITPPAADGADERVYLDLHGGAMIFRGGQLCRAAGIDTARGTGLRTWAVDYRMPPDHPYPAGLDDCLAAYRALLGLRRADQVVVGGSSAGANLAAAMILRARDEGLPLPAAAILLTPHLDLTESGDTFRTNLGVDTVLPASLMPVSLLYAGGADLACPYLSPLFGDFSPGFPPTLLAGGTRDLLLSNAVRMHRSLRDADVPAELHVLEAAQHGLMPRTPEGESLARDVQKFISTHCPPRTP